MADSVVYKYASAIPMALETGRLALALSLILYTFGVRYQQENKVNFEMPSKIILPLTQSSGSVEGLPRPTNNYPLSIINYQFHS
jgi:hypothetical protein